MLKIFLTGDSHIGLKYASHPAAATLAQSRISAFEGMVRTANREGCGLFVIAGDLFENTYGTAKKDIKMLLDLLAGFHGTVAVLPGNHDYYDEESKLWLYWNDLVNAYDNILLLREYRPYPLDCAGERATLYPALCTGLHSAPGQNNLGWLKAADFSGNDGWRIGVAHGAVQGETIDREGEYFLMSRSELESIPMDVWLLGHTHVPFPRNLGEDFAPTGERVFNAGTPVQTDVACGTEGCCFILELSENAPLRAKKVPTGNLWFYRKSLAVSAGGLNRTLTEALASLPDTSVVELLLSGAVTPEEYENRRSIAEPLLARFIEGSVDDHALSKLISKELVDAEFPETSFSAKLLTTLLDEPKEAQLAYELLKTLKEGR